MHSIKESTLEKRFQLLTQSTKRYWFSSILLVVLSITIYITSYLYTLQAETFPVSTDTEFYFTLTSENAYAILNADGTYDLYLYGEYLETVDSLEYYEEFPVYTREEIMRDETK